MKVRHKASTIIIESFFISVSSLLYNPFFNKLSHFTIHLSHPFPKSRLSPSLALFNQQKNSRVSLNPYSGSSAIFFKRPAAFGPFLTDGLALSGFLHNNTLDKGGIPHAKFSQSS
jgi:hypothetical protein